MSAASLNRSLRNSRLYYSLSLRWSMCLAYSASSCPCPSPLQCETPVESKTDRSAMVRVGPEVLGRPRVLSDSASSSGSSGIGYVDDEETEDVLDACLDILSDAVPGWSSPSESGSVNAACKSSGDMPAGPTSTVLPALTLQKEPMRIPAPTRQRISKVLRSPIEDASM